MAERGQERQEYTPSRPFVQRVEYADGKELPYQPLWDVTDPENHHHAEFRLGGNRIGRREVPIEPTPMAFTEVFYSDSIVDAIVQKTNSYARSRLPPSQFEPVTRAEILRFFAIYYYMGLVKLPCRRDYWRGGTDDMWPSHQVCLSMTRARFEYIWRNIHFVGGVADEADEELDIDEDAETSLEEEDESEDYAQNEPENGEEDEEQECDQRWYKKVALFIDHVNSMSAHICIRPGSRLSIDEMMKLFKGRSAQTARMKGKPIKEGYKFWALCDAETGYVYDFIPDGRLASRTIHDVVISLAFMIPVSISHNYVIAMDNYFTRQKVMTSLTEMNIGCVGTARGERNWPPPELKNVDDPRYNTLYTLPDKGKYLIARWIDNNVVTMVTNVHNGDESVERDRKRPRKTNTNRNHLDQVWGQSPVVKVHIPRIIDDYNHWMLGVDKADQLIAYYRPNLRCRRVWMPLLFHAMDIARINSYVAATQLGWKPSKGGALKYGAHKEFVGEFIRALLARATTYETRRSRRNEVEIPSPPTKRIRLSTKNPKLPDHRLYGDYAEHIKTEAPSQGRCIMCAYYYFKAKKERQPLPHIARPKKWCLACRDHLCDAHFQPYHILRHA